MNFNKISIQGFRSFDKMETFDFNSGGFYYVSGENKVEPRLGANGAGKSTVFEALCWTLYGKTSSGIKAGNLKNWNSKLKCKTILSFTKRGETYLLTRIFNPNRIILRGLDEEEEVTKTQDELEDFIGLNFQSFLFSVFVSQFSSKFFDLDPAPKLEVFAQVLDLNKWLVYSDRADVIVKNQKAQLNIFDNEISNYEGRLSQLDSESIEYDDNKKRWDDETCLTLEGMKNDLEGVRGQRDVKKKDIIVKKRMIDRIGIKMVNVETKRDMTQGELDVIKNKVAKSMMTISKLIFSLESGDNRKRELGEVGAVCSNCGQDVTKAHLKKEKDEIDEKMKLVRAERDGLQEGHNKILKDEREIKDKLTTLDKVFSSDNTRYSDLDRAMKGTEGEIYRLCDRIDDIKENILSTENKANPYDVLIKDKDRKRALVMKDIERTKETLGDINEQIENALYWKKGFKEIRLFIIKEALGELEIQMNNSLQELGLVDDWEIQLAVDRETKSGTISKGFTILVCSPFNNELRPFECWSGGEAQRLKLAGTLAMSDFIRQRTGEDWNLEIFDEPTAWLGKEGIEDTVDILSDRCKSNNRETYLIDHRNFETLGIFDGQYKIIKEDEGSRIVRVDL